MARRDFPTPETLRQLLRYEAKTGKLYWRSRPREMFQSQRSFSTWNARFAGKEAFTAVTGGYRVGHVDYKLCMAHRVIMAICNGRWPESDTDHINGDRQDNRWANLREATRSQNLCNTGLRSDNISGHRGVSFHKQYGKWESRLYIDRTRHHLGYFDSLDAACSAYAVASAKYHGEFARQ